MTILWILLGVLVGALIDTLVIFVLEKKGKKVFRDTGDVVAANTTVENATTGRKKR